MFSLNVRQPNGREFWPFIGLKSEMNRLFDNFLPEQTQEDTRGGFLPALDVAENDQFVTVRVEIPGMQPSDIDLQVQGDQLVISGEKRQTVEKDEAGFHHRETRYGKFTRTIALPEGINREQINADYQQGVLTVKLPKSPAITPRKIPVNGG